MDVNIANQAMIVQPPLVLDVLDNNGGFQAETDNRGGTLWRPGRVLKGKTIGTLQHYKRDSFYQMNNNCTRAWYKVPGYRYPVLCWFDNATLKRIA